MNCPRCENMRLDERDRDGVTIDVCKACRGVWLDRGELEKLIARTSAERDDDEGRSPTHFDSGVRQGHGEGDYRKRSRKKGWLESLGDLFD